MALILILLFFAVDDLFIDLVALALRLRPKQIDDEEMRALKAHAEKPVAIMIANWHEVGIIGRMINGNQKQLDYSNFHFFVGVYANDPETHAEVEGLKTRYKNVHVIVNTRPGPTTKGQMLNEIAREIFETEKRIATTFEIFLMHDSEDLMHPLSLRLLNKEIETGDFLQLPVFSYNRRFRDWFGALYIDEFSELHVKDLLVRQALGAPVPSAGVGTALSRQLMLDLLKTQDGNFLREASLTEDYILGLSSALHGFKTKFVCRYIVTARVTDRVTGRVTGRMTGKTKREIIATREYFPNGFGASIRQKTRWVVGIVFQGRDLIPFRGRPANLYFLYRDRRGPFNHLIAMTATCLTIWSIYTWLTEHHWPEFMTHRWFEWPALIILCFMVNRLLQRMRAVAWTNSFMHVILVLPRWPFGNLVNFIATMRALYQNTHSTMTKTPLSWTKTQHDLPDQFGHD